MVREHLAEDAPRNGRETGPLVEPGDDSVELGRWGGRGRHALRFQKLGPTGSEKSPVATNVPSGWSCDRKLRERTDGGPEGRDRAGRDVEGRLVARADQHPLGRPIEPDRTARRGCRSWRTRRSLRAPSRRARAAGAGPRVGRGSAASGCPPSRRRPRERRSRSHRSGGCSRSPAGHRAPTSRFPSLQAVEKSSFPGAGPSDRAGMASAAPRPTERGEQHPDQQLATGETGLLVEGGAEPRPRPPETPVSGASRRRRSMIMRSCAHRTMPIPSEPSVTASRTPSICVWPPRMYRPSSASPVETGDPEQPDDEPFGPRAALPHRCPRRPIQRATRRRPTPYAIQATYPSATGPVPPTGCPPGAASITQECR